MRYQAAFSLQQGDSNDDDVVDIVDFGIFVAARGAGKALDAASNFNSDTVIGTADFSYLGINFFDVVLSGQASAEPPTDASAPWQPNDSFAALWQEFSEHGTLKPKSPPLNAPSLTAKRDTKGTLLEWRIVPNLDGGLRAIRLHRNGKLWKEIGINEDAFLATSRDSTPEELRAHSLVDESKDSHSYTLTFLDIGGNESPTSEAVKVE